MTASRGLALLSIAACAALWLLASFNALTGHAKGAGGAKQPPQGAGNDAGGALLRIAPPAEGVYLGAFPDFGGEEDDVTSERIADFQALSGRAMAWAYFSNNWGERIAFPAVAVSAIHSAGIIPFIRMMPRSNSDGDIPDARYTLQRIARGDFDEELRQWMRDARATGIPLMVEFGTEVNGDWFPWSGRHNGGAEAGPRRFRQAFRHIVDLSRDEQAANLTWVFHVDAQGSPERSWNAMASYYPGDDYVDWLGISAYGAQRPDEDWRSFADVMDRGYAELAAIAPDKPVALLEFGVTDAYAGESKAEWLRSAFAHIRSGRYPQLRAASWWHETFEDDDGTVTALRIDSSPDALDAYQTAVSDPWFVTGIALR